MKKISLAKIFGIAAGVTVLSVMALFAVDWLRFAETEVETFRIYRLEGNVQRYQPQEKQFFAAEENMEIQLGEQLLTDLNSWARVQFFDSGTSMHVDPLSSVAFESEGIQNGLRYAQLRLDMGNLYLVSAGNLMVVDTPQGIAYSDDEEGVFHVRVNLQSAETVVVCLEGGCTVMNDTGQIVLGRGEMASLQGKQVLPAVQRVDQGVLAENVEEEIQDMAKALMRESAVGEQQASVNNVVEDGAGLNISLSNGIGNGNPEQSNRQKNKIKQPTPTPMATEQLVITSPTVEPTTVPTNIPTEKPTTVPTIAPTQEPTAVPTSNPTVAPTSVPTSAPTAVPTEGSGDPDKLLIATIVDEGGYEANPGMGWQYPGGTFPITEPAETVAYGSRADISWKLLNPAEGVYDWSALDSQLKKAISQGKQFSFRVYTMRGESFGGHQVPQWVLNKGAVIVDGEPDYSNCVYQEEWGKFVSQLIKRYDSNPNVAFIDISGYGNFNEWSWQDSQTEWDQVWADAYAKGTASPTTMSNLDSYARRVLADMFIGGSVTKHQCVGANNKVETKSYSYTGFRNTQLVMPYAGIIQSSQYVFTRSKSVGFRYDCLGSSADMNIITPDRFLKELNQIWPKAPVIFETCSGNFSMSDATKLSQTAHASFIHNINQENLSAANVMTLLKPLGYNFKLIDFRHSYQLSPGDTITVQMKWQNTGLAPYYPKMGNKLELRVYFYNPADSMVREFAVPANLATWMPAATYGNEPPVYTVNANFTAGNEFTPGEYYADVKIVEVNSGITIWTSTSVEN